MRCQQDSTLTSWYGKDLYILQILAYWQYCQLALSLLCSCSSMLCTWCCLVYPFDLFVMASLFNRHAQLLEHSTLLSIFDIVLLPGLADLIAHEHESDWVIVTEPCQMWHSECYQGGLTRFWNLICKPSDHNFKFSQTCNLVLLCIPASKPLLCPQEI